MKKAIAQLTQSLLLSLAARSQLQELREKLRPQAVDKGPILKAKPPASQKDILGVCCDPLVLAQQLTHIELVSACEPLRAGWVHGLLLVQSHESPHGFLSVGATGLPCWAGGCQGRPAYSRFLCAWHPGPRGTAALC